MFKSIRNFKASYPYPLEYPIKAVIEKVGLRGVVAWAYQKFSLPVAKENLVINERILEFPIAHQWLGRCFSNPQNTNILEIGHVASSFSLELASIGFQSTAIDLRDYPFTHPNLVSLKGDFLKYNFDKKFDGIVSLSVIEHFGFSQRYGGKDEPGNDYDVQAFAKIASSLAGEGRAIISVPYAKSFCEGVWYRVYTRKDIESKLEQFFTIEEKRYYIRKDNQWVLTDGNNDPEKPFDGVALFLLYKK
ncbi:MAG: hypothetical protein WCW56_01875 [Candidatus Paceibacterota bacterium]|jgi:hypothetical protein